MPAGKLDVAIRQSLRELGEFVEADRAYVFSYDQDSGAAKNTHEWCAQGITPHIDDLQVVPMREIPDFMGPLLSGKPVYIPDVVKYGHRFTREILEAQGIISLLAMPMMHDGTCMGFVGFDSVQRPRRYSDSELRLLRVFADMLVNIQIRTAAHHQLQEEQRRLADIVDGTDAGTWEWDLQTQEMFFNDRFARIIGHASVNGLPHFSPDWQSLVHPDDVTGCMNALVDHLKDRTAHLEVEVRLRHGQGGWVWLLLRGRVVARSETGEALLASGIAIDVSEKKEAEAELRRAASVFTHSREGILITDLYARIIDVNRAFSRITGYSRQEILGQTPRVLNSGRQSPEFYEQMWASLEESGYWSGEVWNRRRDGVEYAQPLTISTVRDERGQAVRYVGLFSDITEQKQYQHNLERLAHFDALTGLANRVSILDRIREILPASRSAEQKIALAYIDVDAFKLINEAHGQETGDQVLKALGLRLKEALRASEMVARPGGDEFVVLLTDFSNHVDLDCRVQKLLAAVTKPLQIGPLLLNVTASAGVATLPDSMNLEPDQFLRQADQAMYEAKRIGRNGVCYFDAEMERVQQQRQDRLRRLHQAYKAGEFVLYYQPKIELRDGSLAGLEALIRWQHPDFGLLSPGEFLPVIEGDPLANLLASWVLSTALSDLSSLAAKGVNTSVAVNISGSVLLQGDLVQTLQRELAAHPLLQPEQLILEVVETSVLGDIQRINEVMIACAELGVRFALDDFGTGFSSLSHLKHLPIHQLKVDQSFVRDMLADPNDLAIIEGVLRLGQAFEMEVLAEGVETDAHVHALLNLGCELAQGYRIAKPMPLAALATWLGTWQVPDDWSTLPRLDSDSLPILFAEAECQARLAQIEARFSTKPNSAQLSMTRLERSRFRRWLGERQTRSGYTELWDLLQRFDMLESEILERLQAGDVESASLRWNTLQGGIDELLSELRARRFSAEADCSSDR